MNWENIKFPLLDGIIISVIAVALFYKYIALALMAGISLYVAWRIDK